MKAVVVVVQLVLSAALATAGGYIVITNVTAEPTRADRDWVSCEDGSWVRWDANYVADAGATVVVSIEEGDVLAGGWALNPGTGLSVCLPPGQTLVSSSERVQVKRVGGGR